NECCQDFERSADHLGQRRRLLVQQVSPLFVVSSLSRAADSQEPTAFRLAADLLSALEGGEERGARPAYRCQQVGQSGDVVLQTLAGEGSLLGVASRGHAPRG